MSPTLAGLAGTIVGALGALLAVFLTHLFSLQRERDRHQRELEVDRDKWLREQKQVCYHNAVKYLLRVRAVGARANNTETVRLPHEAPDGWYDDIAEANAWLSSLHYYCGEDQMDILGENAVEFENLSSWLIGFRPTGTISSKHFSHLLSADGQLDYQAFVDTMTEIEVNISNCARRDR